MFEGVVLTIPEAEDMDDASLVEWIPEKRSYENCSDNRSRE